MSVVSTPTLVHTEGHIGLTVDTSAVWGLVAKGVTGWWDLYVAIGVQTALTIPIVCMQF